MTHNPTPNPTLTPAPTLVPSPLPTLKPSPLPTQVPTLHPEILISTNGPLFVSEADNKGGGGGGAQIVSVWLSNEPTSDVYVAVKSTNGQVAVNGTAKAALEDRYRDALDQLGAYALNPGFVYVGPFTSSNWMTPQTFSVAAVDDDLAEWSEADFTYTTQAPTQTPQPSPVPSAPSALPSALPSQKPTEPSPVPTLGPSMSPSTSPTQNPSSQPSQHPTNISSNSTSGSSRRRLKEPSGTSLNRRLLANSTDDEFAWYRNSNYQSALETWKASQPSSHDGDDDLDVYGVSSDSRYSNLRPECGTIRVLVTSDDVAGVLLSYPYVTSSTTAGEVAAAIDAVGNTSLSVGVTEGVEGWNEEGVNNGVAYAVSLRSKPRDIVILTLSSAFEAHRWLVANSTMAASFSPAELVFTETDWLVPQAVTVTVANDDIARRDSSFVMEITHQATSSADDSYTLAASTQPALELTVTEDDTAGLFFSTTKLFLGCDFNGDVLFGDFYSLALNSQPTHAVRVTLSAWESGTGVRAPLTHIGTQDFVFTPATWNVEELVVVNATSYDLQKRTDVIYHQVESLDYMYGYDSSAASGTYATDSVGASNSGLGPKMPVSVTVSRDATPPPKLQTTYFRAVGGAAELIFDRFTNYAGLTGVFDCSTLLTGPAIDGIGSSGYCNWQSSTKLVITLSGDASVLPGEFFYIRNNMLQSSAPNTTLYVTNATGRLLSPATAVSPDVTLTAPSVIGTCDSLIVDARLTTGSGGRAMFVVWNVTFPSGVHENATIANLTAAVELATATNALFITVPNNDIPVATMLFALKASNWLGNTEKASVEVKKVNADPPLVQILGYGTTTTAFAADELKLTASATFSPCGRSGTLQFQWRETTGYLSSRELAALSTSQPRTIRVGSGVMKAGLTYAFEATVFLRSDQDLNSTATLLVTAKASPLFASIDGGSKILQYRGNDIVLDGSGSYDPDSTVDNSHLNFTWTCYDKYTGKSCVNATSNSDVGGLVIVAPTAVTTVPAFTLSAGDFVLRLWVKCLTDGRNATASVEVTLSATQVPIVAITPLAVTKVNPNPGTYVSLQGAILGDTSSYGVVTYEWTKTEGDDVSADSGYTSVFAVSTTRLLTVLELGALTQGSSYSFRLTATATGTDDARADSASGYAEVTVVVNSPPSSGLFTATPGTGVALQTEFALVCSSWVDDVDDLPLKYGFRAAPGVEVAAATSTQASEQLLVSLGTTPSYTTLLPEGDTASGNVSLVAYITDRYSGQTRATTMVGVGSLADSFSASLGGGRRRLLESDAFANFVLNLTSTLMTDAASIGSSEDMFKNANNLVSVANSPSGAAGMTTEKQQELIGELVTNMNEASETMESSEESIELMMGSMGSVANGQLERLDSSAQTSLFSNSLALLSTAATPGSRVAISDASSSSACSAIGTLLSSADLFGTGNSNSSNNSKALGDGLTNLASGKLIGRFAGMSATETSCSGIIISAQKLSAEDTDGLPLSAGNSSFTMPSNFSAMANISTGDTIETSAQILESNPYRGISSAAINTDLSSLSMLVTRAGRTDGGTDPLPVNNLTNPISIRIPVKSLGPLSNDDEGNYNMTRNVTCPGTERLHTIHTCPGGAFINYTCDLSTLPYTVRLKCVGGVAHQCVFWDTSSLTWSSKGCRQVGFVATGGNSGFVTCNCTHLTDFASQLDETLDLASNVVTSVDTLSLSDVLNNILVLIVLLVVWGAMAVACIYSRYLDGVARKKVVPFGHLTDSEDEGDNGSHERGNAGGDDGRKGNGDATEAIIRFLAKGDGTDYGQMPDTLTSAALTRRMNRHLLKWRVYQDQSQEAFRDSRKQLKRGPFYSRSKVPLRERTLPSSNGRTTRSPSRPRGGKVVPFDARNAETKGDSSAEEADVQGAMPVVPVDVAPDGQLVIAASTGNVHTQAPVPTLTVSTLKTVLTQEKSKVEFRGKLLMDWWEFMKTQHKILSIFFTKDDVFTRPERIMVIGVFILFTMALNSFLFIFQGNANAGENDTEIFLNTTTYIVVASVCQTPLMFIIVLLFRRTSPPRPILEDRWVGAPRSDIPKKVRICVEAREEVLRSERAVRRAKDSTAKDKRMLRGELEKRMERAIAQGLSELPEEEAAEVVLLSQQCEAEGEARLGAAKERFQEASQVLLRIREAQQQWMERRVVDLLGDPVFETPTGWNRVELWVRCFPLCGQEAAFLLVCARAKRTAERELKNMYLSRQERAIAKVEREQMAKFGDTWYGWLQQWAYRKYLNPLRDLKKLFASHVYLPGWVVYLVHGFALLFALFCSYYTFLFSVMINKCAKCGPEGSLDDDDAEKCSSCPASMRDNKDPNTDLAMDWLLTLLYTLLFNVFLLEPLKAGAKAAVYPVLVNSWLAIKWDRYLLAAQRARELEEDVSDDEDENLFAVLGRSGPLRGPSELVAKATAVMPTLAKSPPISDEGEDPHEEEEVKERDEKHGGDGGNEEEKEEVKRSKEPRASEDFEDRHPDRADGASPLGASLSPSRRDVGENGSKSGPHETPLPAKVQASAATPAMTPVPFSPGGNASGVDTPEETAPTVNLDTKSRKKHRKKRKKKHHHHHDRSRSKSRGRSLSSSRGGGGGGGSGHGSSATQDDNSDPSTTQRQGRSSHKKSLSSKLPPLWECACGHKCPEAGRRDHLGECQTFQRSWRAAFRVLMRAVFEQRQAQEGLDSGGGGEGSERVKTVEQRLAALEEEVAHHYALEQAAVQEDEGEGNESAGALGAAAAAATVEVGEAAGDQCSRWATVSRSGVAARTRWWTRGMLLASLVESGGDWRKAAKKLCRQGAKRNAKVNKAAAELYRKEMQFVADHVGLEALLVEHSAQMRLADLS